MPTLPFHQNDPEIDPGRKQFQFLEDLSTAYWYSELLFTALETEIFAWIEKGCDRLGSLAEAAGCRPPELARLMRGLEKLELVHCFVDEPSGKPRPGIPEPDGNDSGLRRFNTPQADTRPPGIYPPNTRWRNNRLAKTFLCPGADNYMGDFLIYRRYMQPRWQELTRRVLKPGHAPAKRLSEKDDYRLRNRWYVRSTDRLMLQKAVEILPHLKRETWSGPVLDAGGGAGSMGRTLVRERPGERSVLMDLEEVIETARAFYPDDRDWRQVMPVAGDFRFHPFRDHSFGVVVLSNFLHVYGPETARKLLHKAISLLKPGGLLVIHDYFPDRMGSRPHKGALYDLNMMLNTYDGVCHEAGEIIAWIKERGMPKAKVADLETDTSLILAGF